VRSLSLIKPEVPCLFEFALPALLTCWFVRKRRLAEITFREARDELQSRIEQRQAEMARVSRMMTVGEMGVSSAYEVYLARAFHSSAVISQISPGKRLET
jgi:C4-dicarboxylate-specific signal transduction histidine kinase